jgi:hypothetical protein
MEMTELSHIPVAFFFFNRAETAALTFKRIAAVRPARLFLVSDGPRPHVPGEDVVVEDTRQRVLDQIDWRCEVSTNFAEENLGCKRRLISGIDWVFTQATHAIILEDDCEPTEAFFHYVGRMLDIYRENKMVFAISGSSFAERALPSGHILSDYALMWGWATWADRWQYYKSEPMDYRSIVIAKWWKRPIEMLYWLSVFDNLIKRKVDTWDYQWILTVWRCKGAVIRPAQNLITNVGFGPGATHTTGSDRFTRVLTKQSPPIEGEFDALLTGPVRRYIARQDRRLWALINVRTVLLLRFPALQKLRRKST